MVRIYKCLADLLQKIMMKNSKLQFSEYMQNVSRAKIFGKFVLIVNQSTSSTLVACTISIAIMYHTIEGNHSMLLNSALSSVMHRCSTQWSKTGKTLETKKQTKKLGKFINRLF